MAEWLADSWEDKAFADVDLTVVVADSSSASNDTKCTVLCKIAAHRLVLSRSPYLKAQMLRWQHKRPLEEDTQHPNPQHTLGPHLPVSIETAAKTPLPDQHRTQVVLTLQDNAHEPAARAVLASLYDKKTSELLAGLTQDEQLAAAVLADMWDVPAFSAAAANALLAAAKSPARLEAAVSQQLLHMQALPAVLQPVLGAVLAVYRDLEAVWRDVRLQEELMALPVHIMEELLSAESCADHLKAACEDNVLYTAESYVRSIEDEEQRKAACQRLAPLIRCPHLSPIWLVLSVFTSKGPSLLQDICHRDTLLMHLLANRRPIAADVRKCFPGAPESWQLGPRERVVVNTAELKWSLPVIELKMAAEACAATQKEVVVMCPRASPPLGGIAWELAFKLTPSFVRAGLPQSQWGTKVATVNMCHGITNGAEGMSCSYNCLITVAGATVYANRHSGPTTGNRGFVDDVFGVGSMAAGWDERLLVEKRVPTSGDLNITMLVTSDSVAGCFRG